MAEMVRAQMAHGIDDDTYQIVDELIGEQDGGDNDRAMGDMDFSDDEDVPEATW